MWHPVTNRINISVHQPAGIALFTSAHMKINKWGLSLNYRPWFFCKRVCHFSTWLGSIRLSPIDCQQMSSEMKGINLTSNVPHSSLTLCCLNRTQLAFMAEQCSQTDLQPLYLSPNTASLYTWIPAVGFVTGGPRHLANGEWLGHWDGGQ